MSPDEVNPFFTNSSEPPPADPPHYAWFRSGHKLHSPSTTSLVDMNRGPQPLRLLIAANCEIGVAKAEKLARSLSKNPNVETKAIVDDMMVLERLRGVTPAYFNQEDHYCSEDMTPTRCRSLCQMAFELCQWADMLVVVPMDHNSIAKMLQGISDSLLLEIVRGWDASKKMLVVPGMTTIVWENPMTKRHLVKIGKKMSWIRVMSPILWHYDEVNGRVKGKWTGFDEIMDAIQNQADLSKIGHDVEIPTSIAQQSTSKTDVLLPPELWTLIMNFVGDWETATALGIYTKLPQPADWDNSAQDPNSPLQKYMKELAYIILSCDVQKICAKLAAMPKTASWLSSLCVKLIIKFSLSEVLSYMEINMKDILWASFGPKLLPTKASAAFNRTKILEWWRTSPTFLTKDYTSEALDGASKSGFVDVLEWWRKSGLPLKFTETALEKSSAKGHIHVLEWWKEASQNSGGYDADVSYQSDNDLSLPTSSKPHAGFHLLVGKSICAAAQNGQAAVIQWFEDSGIPYLHSEAVAKLASANGHVNVLEVWKSLKGEKMVFDNQVLVSPTKNGHVDVLEWWKQSGLKVEYKTCDIEEALEDSVGGEVAKQNVKKWWATNGLNLGIQTSEWMKVKTL